jgi:hypothetical protein
MDDLDELDNHFLDMEVSKLRSWLLLGPKQESFFRHLQRQVTYRQHNSSTPQDQSTDPSSKSASQSSSSPPSTSTSVPSTLSGGTSNRSKRRRDDTGEDDEQQEKEGRIPQKEPRITSAPRLACFYNKYDPIMYGSNGQARKKFEICETHDFQNMNKLL